LLSWSIALDMLFDISSDIPDIFVFALAMLFY
jgi:hypothetical protein